MAGSGEPAFVVTIAVLFRELLPAIVNWYRATTHQNELFIRAYWNHKYTPLTAKIIHYEFLDTRNVEIQET